MEAKKRGNIFFGFVLYLVLFCYVFGLVVCVLLESRLVFVVVVVVACCPPRAAGR